MPLAVTMLPVNALVYVLDGALVGAADFQVIDIMANPYYIIGS